MVGTSRWTSRWTSRCDVRAACSGATFSNGSVARIVHSVRYHAAGDGAARHPYHRGTHIARNERGEGWGEGKSNKTKLLSPTHNARAHSLALPVRRVRAKPPERLRRRKDQGRWGQRPSPLGGMLSSTSHYFSSRRANELLRRKRGRRPLPF